MTSTTDYCSPCLNARTGDLLDYMDDEDNLINKRNTPLPNRNNCDKVINQQGKKLIDLCKTFDLQILNGRHKGDMWGNLTHYNKHKGASLVDVAVVSDNLIKEIKHFFVLPQNEISDHCKIVVHMNNIKNDYIPENPKYDWKKFPSGHIWEENDFQNYKLTFNDPEVKKSN